MRRERRASRRWLGRERFRTVLLKTTFNSSASRTNSPASGLSPVLTTTPSLTHCQNCACVVQNCLRSRQTTSAVRFVFLFSAFRFALLIVSLLPLIHPCRHVSLSFSPRARCYWLVTSYPLREGEASEPRRSQLVNASSAALSYLRGPRAGRLFRSSPRLTTPGTVRPAAR